MYSRTGFFQSMRRSSTKRAKPVVVNGFETDMSWNCVSVVTFKPASTSRRP